MHIIKTHLEGLVVIEPKVWGDERGYFFESYSKAALAQYNLDYNWIQDNEAFSTKGVLRGLHYQTGDSAQTKLVRATYGEVLDVVVDIRPDSPTYGQSLSIILSGRNKKQLLVPRGFAHGYVVLSDTALFQYKVDNLYNADAEAGISYKDEQLSIDWILSDDLLKVSAKDKVQPNFENHIPAY